MGCQHRSQRASLLRRVLTEAAGDGGAAVCWSYCDLAQLDVLPLLRHGRALGFRRRVASVLGLRQPGVQTTDATPLRHTSSSIVMSLRLCSHVCFSAQHRLASTESLRAAHQMHQQHRSLTEVTRIKLTSYNAVQITTVDEAKQFYPLFGLGANVALIFSGRAVVYFSQVPVALRTVLHVLLLCTLTCAEAYGKLNNTRYRFIMIARCMSILRALSEHQAARLGKW